MKFTLDNVYELRQLIKHLSSGLRRLTLSDNFQGTEIQILIPAGSELKVRNPLQFVPNRYIIVSQTGNSNIVKSNTWTSDFLYFTNHGIEDSNATIQLLR